MDEFDAHAFHQLQDRVDRIERRLQAVGDLLEHLAGQRKAPGQPNVATLLQKIKQSPPRY